MFHVFQGHRERESIPGNRGRRPRTGPPPPRCLSPSRGLLEHVEHVPAYCTYSYLYPSLPAHALQLVGTCSTCSTLALREGTSGEGGAGNVGPETRPNVGLGRTPWGPRASGPVAARITPWRGRLGD